MGDRADHCSAINSVLATKETPGRQRQLIVLTNADFATNQHTVSAGATRPCPTANPGRAKTPLKVAVVGIVALLTGVLLIILVLSFAGMPF